MSRDSKRQIGLTRVKVPWARFEEVDVANHISRWGPACILWYVGIYLVIVKEQILHWSITAHAKDTLIG